MGVIRDELLEIKEKYNDKRRTKIVADAAEMDEEDLIEEEQVCSNSYSPWIYQESSGRHIQDSEARRQGHHRTLLHEKTTLSRDLIMTSTLDYLMFFTNTGKAHKIKAYEIPEATRTAKGNSCGQLPQSDAERAHNCCNSYSGVC